MDREMVVSTSEATLREHGISIEAVSAHHGPWPQCPWPGQTADERCRAHYGYP